MSFLTCLLHINFHPVVGYTTKKNKMIDDIFWVYWSDLKKHGITEFSWLINLAVNS